MTECLVCTALEKLTNEEGTTVTIIAPNTDFSGPDRQILCSGDWTNYLLRHFNGDTLIQCLDKAIEMKGSK